MEKIYETIARQHGITAEEVKEEMRAAISLAYEKPNAFAQSVTREEKIPSVEEFIAFACKQILREMKNEKSS